MSDNRERQLVDIGESKDDIIVRLQKQLQDQGYELAENKGMKLGLIQLLETVITEQRDYHLDALVDLHKVAQQLDKIKIGSSD